jgi:hypothetical protein
MGIANEIIERGWIQGMEYQPYYDEDEPGGVCLRGAIYCHVFGSAYYEEAGPHNLTEGTDRQEAEFRRITSAAIAKARAMGFESDTAFNDEVTRTRDEVLRFAKEFDEELGLD